MRSFSLALAPLVLAPFAVGQAINGIGQPTSLNGGTGNFDAQAAATAGAGYATNGLLGVTMGANGHYYVSGRQNTAAPGSGHNLFEFDGNGAFVASYAQPPGVNSAAGTWGIRDMTTDVNDVINPVAGESHIYGSDAATTVYEFDENAGAYTGVTFSVGAPCRAIAVVNNTPVGGPGFAVCNWSDPLTFWDSTGLNKGTWPSANSAIYGLGADEARQTVWLHGQNGSSHPLNPGTVFTEVDIATGTATGQRYLGDLSITGSAPGGIAGGLECYDPNPTDSSGELYAVYLSQATSDTVGEAFGRFNFGTSAGGSINFQSSAFYGNANFAVDANNIAAQYVNAFLLAGVAAPGGFPIPQIAGPLYINPALGLIAAGSSPVNIGTASAALPIPNDPGLLGVRLAWQWLLVANPPSLPVGSTDGGCTYVGF